MLGPGCEEAALAALRAYPQGLQIGGACVKEGGLCVFMSFRLWVGLVWRVPSCLTSLPVLTYRSTCPPNPRSTHAGGITPETAGRYLEAGASHVIVTSYLFQGAAVR